MDEAEVKVIKVDLDGRYLVVVESASHLTEEEGLRIREQLTAGVRDWWASGEKFGLLVFDAGLKFSLQRVDPEGK